MARLDSIISNSCAVDGGTPPYVFSAVSGMPAGLSLNTNGLVTGRPRETGNGTVTLRVMDGRGHVATQPCGLAIAPSPLVIVGTCPLPQARVGAPYLQRFTASGGVAPYRFRLDGALPARPRTLVGRNRPRHASGGSANELRD